MCLINIQFHDHPNYKLIVAANRDEFYKRPTAPAHFWKDVPQLLAGRDLVQKGTWLGITKNGRFAALTNYRDPNETSKGKHSRGQIVRDYLAGDCSPLQFLHSLRKNRGSYAGFNVIVGSAEKLFHYSNITDEITEVPPGVHGVSNHLLNTPWPKVVKGKRALEHYMGKIDKLDPHELFKIVSDAELADESVLPNTGVGIELERKLSPLFIQMPDYGTRSSTVLSIDRSNSVNFLERSYERGKQSEEKQFKFQITDCLLSEGSNA